MHTSTVTGEPLRQRRRRELRQQISDEATRLFLERGFDAVRVVDVARACGTTEKTIFSHFKTKESLLADRWDVVIAEASTAFSQIDKPLVHVALGLLHGELEHIFSAVRLDALGLRVQDLLAFSELIRSTASLRSYERGNLDRLVTVIEHSQAVSNVVGCTAATTAVASPRQRVERRATAIALSGLWDVFYRGLHDRLLEHHASGDAARIKQAVRRDLRFAAAVISDGLGRR